MKRQKILKAAFIMLFGLVLWVLISPYIMSLGTSEETVINEKGGKSFVTTKSWLGFLVLMSGLITFFVGLGSLFK